MAARSGRNSNLGDGLLAMVQSIGHQELLSMYRIVDGQSCKLQVDTHIQAPACPESHCSAQEHIVSDGHAYKHPCQAMHEHTYLLYWESCNK